MPQSITLTLPDADVPRVQAALQALGQTPKQYLTATLRSLVQAYEAQQAAQQQAAQNQPINPQ